MGKIMAVNISEKKGTQKKNVHSAKTDGRIWNREGRPCRQVASPGESSFL